MDEDDETLPKKINDLTDMVRELRREIGEMKADQDTLEVINILTKTHFMNFKHNDFSSILPDFKF